jgi:hypothetical protein
MSTELMPKRFELLSELVPQARVMALLVNPNYAIPSASFARCRKRPAGRECSSTS